MLPAAYRIELRSLDEAFKSSITNSLLIRSYCPYGLTSVPTVWLFVEVTLNEHQKKKEYSM